MKKMTCAELAEFLFSHRETPAQLEFYAEYNTVTGEKSWAFQAVTANFVDSQIVLVNYYGGGALFAYEFTDSDTDASGLRSCLETYFFTAELGDGVWVEMPGSMSKPKNTVEKTIQVCRQQHDIEEVTIIEGLTVSYSGPYEKFFANCDPSMIIFRNDLLKREVAGTHLLAGRKLFVFIEAKENQNSYLEE